jgi:hypothetical protein
MTTDSDTHAQDARAWCSVQLAGQPLVPAEARTAGASSIIAAALRQLAALRREQAPVVHHRTASAKACSRCNTEPGP